MAACAKPFALKLPVPITKGTNVNGGQLFGACWKHAPGMDKWARLPDAPHDMEQGGAVVPSDRHTVSLGSTHAKNSFWVGANAARMASPDMAHMEAGSCRAMATTCRV